jgi:SAM-dependent methyltransferase
MSTTVIASNRTVACLVCGSGRLRLLYEGVRDHAGVAPDPYRFLECAECGSATLDPMPTPDAIPQLYPPDYTFKAENTQESGGRRFMRELEWRLFYRPIYRQRLGVFRRLTGLRGGRVLEVGCGSGLFLRELARAGFEVEGLDISAADITYAREHLGLTAFQGSAEKLTLEPNRYDAVVAMSVLEHVPQPLDTVRQVLRGLKPGGWIVLGLPVIESWQSRLLGARWCAITEAPRHLMVPSAEGVRRLLAAAGYDEFRTAPGSLVDSAGFLVLSAIPGVSTPRTFGRSASLSRLFRRWAGAALVGPALLLAWAERLPRRAPGYVVFCGRKPLA